MASNVLQQLMNILDGNYSGQEQANKLIALRRQCEHILTRTTRTTAISNYMLV